MEAEIKRRQIDTKYVPLACSKEEVDSVTGRQIAVSRYEEEDGWIDGYMRLFASYDSTFLCAFILVVVGAKSN